MLKHSPNFRKSLQNGEEKTRRRVSNETLGDAIDVAEVLLVWFLIGRAFLKG